ncbi:hypothetical protein BHM03_00053626 [Ensete ventricosum]|uniref:Uncharacterized protein n=1 Tax=Ensete ventricosum TaxID=4639 RepID=A0A445MM23_ENSVE|nr:hypothetical protein BHM03_00053626 [Ensete ventricosum]
MIELSKVFIAKIVVFLTKEHILDENSGSEIELSDVREPSSSTIPESEFVQEIVYPSIPDPDGEDEGGQASSSLAISTRWISAVKLLKSDLTTLVQREGGEYEVVAKVVVYQP